MLPKALAGRCRWLGLVSMLVLPALGSAQELNSRLINGDFEQGGEAGSPGWTLQVWPASPRSEFISRLRTSLRPAAQVRAGDFCVFSRGGQNSRCRPLALRSRLTGGQREESKPASVGFPVPPGG